jgi:hypothetical protein
MAAFLIAIPVGASYSTPLSWSRKPLEPSPRVTGLNRDMAMLSAFWKAELAALRRPVPASYAWIGTPAAEVWALVPTMAFFAAARALAMS